VVERLAFSFLVPKVMDFPPENYVPPVKFRDNSLTWATAASFQILANSSFMNHTAIPNITKFSYYKRRQINKD